MKRREPTLVLKLDMEKAYDSLDWSFLMDMLRGLGFGRWFIDLIYRSLSNNWFSTRISGEQACYFKSFRGVKQGDPFSLGLFIIAAEFLNRAIHHLFSNGFCMFYQSLGGQIPIISFADDTIIFIWLTKSCLSEINHFLNKYQMISR